MTDDKRRRRIRFFDDDDEFFSLFGDIDELVRREMERVFNMINKILQDSDVTGQPLVYGFRVTIGPDGVPKIQTFGNVKAGIPEGVKPQDVFEPTVDVIEEDDQIRIIVDIPGAKKESIKIKAKDDAIYVEAEGERKYAKRIKLPAKIDPKSARAKYKNGILEIVVKKHKEDEGIDVGVE